VGEALDILSGGDGEPAAADLMTVTFALAEAVSRLAGEPLGRPELERAIASGRAREAFERWAAAQGAEAAWLRSPGRALAPVVVPLRAARSGTLAAVDVRGLGHLLVEAGGGRARPEDAIDFGISLETLARLGQPVAAGEELARVYLRREDAGLAAAFAGCFTVGDQGAAPPLLYHPAA
jgi:thymidine phosphorylase